MCIRLYVCAGIHIRYIHIYIYIYTFMYMYTYERGVGLDMGFRHFQALRLFAGIMEIVLGASSMVQGWGLSLRS